MATQTSTTTKTSKDEAAKKREVKAPLKQEVSATELAPSATDLQRAATNPQIATRGEILALQRRAGNRAVTQLIQAKLKVGPANDSYEQEADRVAAQVMAAPAETPSIQRQGEEEEIQTKPLAASITPLIQRSAAAEEEELQAKSIADGGSFVPGPSFESRLASTRGDGKSLPEATRDFMEQRFGADFSGVRLHTGSESTELNRAIGAQAFTRGQDIYLGEGKENVESNAGKQLLAHELTHTIQQGAARSLQRKAAAMKWASVRSASGKFNSISNKTSANVVQRAWTDKLKHGAAVTGKVVGGVALGPLWDAGKAMNRRRKGGNLLLGGQGYRRYARQDPRAGKADEYRSGADLSTAYGGAAGGAMGRGIGILSTLAGDVAKYAGWGAGVLGIIMLASAGTLAPALAPVATILAGITGLALTVKLSLTAMNQAYLADRMDRGATGGEVRKEEQYARSDYGRAAVAAGGFALGGLAAEASAGSDAGSAWLETTGQTEATSSLPEVLTGSAGEAALEIGDVAQEETGFKFNEEFGAAEKPKKTIGMKKWLHWLNPVYLLIRTLRQIENLSGAALNSFKKEGEHKKTKEVGGESALYKVGDTVSGQEGFGHKAVRSFKNFFRSKNNQIQADDTIATGSREGYGRTGLKYMSQGLGGVVGGAIGATGGAIGGTLSGGYHGMKRLGAKGWSVGSGLRNSDNRAYQALGYVAGGTLGFLGGIVGGAAGAVTGGVLGLGKGAASGAKGGWEAARGAPRAGEAVGGRIWDKTGQASDWATEKLSKIPVAGKPLAAIAGLGIGAVGGTLALGAGAVASAGQIATSGIAAGIGASKATSEAVNAQAAGETLPAHLADANRINPDAVPAGGYSLVDSLDQFVTRTKNYVKQGEDGLKDIEKHIGTP